MQLSKLYIYIYIYQLSLIKTLRLNFHYFPFKQAVKLPLLVSKNVKLRNIKGKINLNNYRFGNIRIGFNLLGIFDSKKEATILEIGEDSEINLSDNFIFASGCKLSIGKNAKLSIGENVTITGNTTIICNKEIIIDDQSLLSWDILIMDTDSHKIYSDNRLINAPAKVHIGKNVWVGCRSTILKGSIIPDNSVVAAGSIVAGKFSTENAIYGGSPVRILKENISWER